MSATPKRKTLKDEYAQVVQEMQSTMGQLETHQKDQDTDLKNAEQLVNRLVKKAKINQKVTPQEISVLSMYVRQAVSGQKVNSAMFEFLLASFMKLGILLQDEERMKLDVPANIVKELQTWTEAQERAKKAWSEYIK